MKVLAFRIFGDLAHFRKFFTTSSPLTFSFPPPPTIRGIVGAIMGFGKDKYLEETKYLWIGIKIDKPLKKIRMGLNLVDTKNYPIFKPPWKRPKSKAIQRTQVKVEFLKDVSFTVYLYSEDELTQKLYSLVKEHKTHYTVSLGLSELLADSELVGIFEAEKAKSSEYVNSVVPVNVVKELNLERPQKLGKERIPVHMDVDRKVLKYEDVIFSMEGKPIYGTITKVYKLSNGEVVWLWKPPQK